MAINWERVADANLTHDVDALRAALTDDDTPNAQEVYARTPAAKHGMARVWGVTLS